MKSHKILITGALHQSALDLFQSRSDFSIVYKPDCSRSELLEASQNCHVLVTRSETDVDKEVFECAKNLKVVARAAVGIGNIDLDEATRRGVLVFNCPGKNTNAAAELTWGLLLSMLRNIPPAQSNLKNGGWDRHRYSGYELRGKTIGIVGLGNVGHRVAKFAHGFDMRVLAFDPYLSPDAFQRHGALRIESLEQLAAQSDVLTVHVPLTRETKGMVHRDIIGRMPKNSYIVNAARGGVCVEADLVTALKEGHIRAVGLDTFDHEPSPRSDLVKHERVFCTPHIGASTEEAQIAIGETVFDQVVKAIEGGVVDYPVNLPGIGIPDSSMLKAYAVLAQKLGALLGQICDFKPDSIQLRYRGDLAGIDTKLVRLSLMKGYAAHLVDDYVSLVNTTAQFEKLGVRYEEQSDPDFSDYKSALKVIARDVEGHQMSVGGIVFDGTYPRISLINDFYFEIDPAGTLLLTENHDRPGVIGDIGHFLGASQINIDHFTLSRNRRGGKAMAVIRTDSPVTDEHIKGIRELSNVTEARVVYL